MAQMHTLRFSQPALDAVPSAMAILDPHGQIVYVNDAWKRFGEQNGLATTHHALDVNYLDVCEASDDPGAHRIAQGLRDVLAGTLDTYTQVYPCHSPQAQRWFQLRATRFEDHGLHLLVIHEDITEHHRLEAQWRTQAELNESLLRSSPDCVKRLSLDGNLLWMNAGGQQLMEIGDFERLRGRPWADVWPPEAQADLQAALSTARQGNTGRFQGGCPTANGTLKYWDVVVTPILGSDGQPVELLASSRDLTALRAAQDEVLHRAQETTRILTSIQEGFYALDDAWRFTYLNPKAEAMLGRSAAELLGSNVWDAFPDAVGTVFEVEYTRAMRERCRVHFETYFPPLHTWFGVHVAPHGRGLAVFFQDINAQKAEEDVQQHRNAVLEMTVQHQPLDEILHRVAAMVEQQFPGHPCTVMLERTGRLVPYAAPSFPRDLRHAWGHLDLQDGHGACGAAVRHGHAVTVEDTATDPTCAEVRSLLLHHDLRAALALPIRDGAGRVLGAMTLYARTPGPFPLAMKRHLERAANLAAVTIEHHRQAEQLVQQAEHDALTGLANRALFERRLERTLATAREEAASVALLFIDVDDFKGVNDGLGHDAGDAVLREVARRLQGCVRRGDTVARISGDEFTVILPHAGEADALGVARRFLTALAEPVMLGERRVEVAASVGLSLASEAGYDAEALQRAADTAMYHAKRQRSGLAVFGRDMHRRAYERRQLAGDLRGAVERGELQVHYQPLVQLEDGVTVGAEALLRWTHPQLGPVSPAAFIPLAEETGLIVPIGAWVLREACRQGAAWAQRGRPLRVAVNVSALQFEHPEFLDTVAACLRDTAFPPDLLELELTERLVMQDVEASIARMAQLRALGVSIAVDDFGTGYSSLSYLPRLPVNVLKIDRSFVTNLTPSSPTYTVVRAIVNLADSLGLLTIAEGIETDEERTVLLDLGCRTGQGFLFARPRPASDPAWAP